MGVKYVNMPVRFMEMVKTDAKNFWAWFKEVEKNDDQEYLTIDVNGQVAGVVALFNIDINEKSASFGIMLKHFFKEKDLLKHVIDLAIKEFVEKYSLETIHIEFDHNIKYFKELFRGIQVPDAKKDAQARSERVHIESEAFDILKSCEELLEPEDSRIGILRKYYDVVVDPVNRIEKITRNLLRLKSQLQSIKCQKQKSLVIAEGDVSNEMRFVSNLKGEKGQRTRLLVEELELGYPELKNLNLSTWTENEVRCLSRALDILMQVCCNAITNFLKRVDLKELIKKKSVFMNALEGTDEAFIYNLFSMPIHKANHDESKQQKPLRLPKGMKVVVIGSGQAVKKKKDFEVFITELGGVCGGFVDASNLQRVHASIKSAYNYDTVIVFTTRHISHKVVKKNKKGV